MPPVVAVCPVHRAFTSRMFVIENSEDVTLRGNYEPCATPGCRLDAAVMDGTFDFDADGIASVLSAPDWSVDALRSVQGGLREALHDLTNPALSGDEAFSRFDEKLDQILASSAAKDAQVDRLVTEVKSLRLELTRSKLAKAIGAIIFALAFVVDAGAAVDLAAEMVHWVSEQAELDLPDPSPSCSSSGRCDRG